jgi:hypothetical protein
MGFKRVKIRHKIWGPAQLGGIITSLPRAMTRGLKTPAKMSFGYHKKRGFSKGWVIPDIDTSSLLSQTTRCGHEKGRATLTLPVFFDN